MDKAYKLLSLQLGISNKKAKEMIDRGLVQANGKRINLARENLPASTRFHITQLKSTKILFKDNNLLALDKPAFVESHDLCREFPEWVLLHRLDRETSGVILLVKENSDFHIKAKKAFANKEVYKEYRALVSGFISEERSIDERILTIKKGFAKSKISKDGFEAHTHITPLSISGKKTLLKVIITTGRTHQIRIHLKHIGHSIIGDKIYGGINAARLMLHAHRIKLFGYDITSQIPAEFERE